MNTTVEELEKSLAKAKFKLSQQASELHDLIEDRLPADYLKIPLFADSTFKACEEWDIIRRQLEDAKKAL